MTFNPAQYVTIGDEYDKKTAGVPDRFKGRSFLTNPGKKGRGADTLFGKKFISLAEGDKYVDPGYFDKRQRLQNEKKVLVPGGFKYTNGTKDSCGKGTYYGTFSEKAPWKHEVEFSVHSAQGTLSAPKLRNMVTNPGKKGSYGTPGLGIGGTKGSETKYVSDPYDAAKQLDAMVNKEKGKAVIGPAFKAACKRGGYFDETAHGISRVYTIDKALPMKRMAADEGKVAAPPVAWKPGGKLDKTIYKPFPYMEDPSEAKEKKMREEQRSKRPVVAWKPIGPSKSMPTRNVSYNPPAFGSVRVVGESTAADAAHYGLASHSGRSGNTTGTTHIVTTTHYTSS